MLETGNLFQSAVGQIFLEHFGLNGGDWKLVPGPFMILLK